MEKVKIDNFPVGTPASFVGIDVSGKEILAKIDDVLRMDYKAISSGTNKLSINPALRQESGVEYC